MPNPLKCYKMFNMKIRYGLFFQWPILHKTPLAGGVWAVSGGVWMVSGMYLRTEEVSGCSNPLAKF